jgi:hypothetical protein
VDFKLELVLIPVSDVDPAKTFYIEKAGFTLDVDHSVSAEVRIVQLTQPGSACSTTMGTGITDAVPGSVSARRAGRHQDRGGPGRPSPGQRDYPESVPAGASLTLGGRA